MTSSRDKTPAKKTFQNLPRNLFFHTLDFVSAKEIETRLRHVNKEWNKFTKEEFALKKLPQRRCEEHPQHTNPKSFLNFMLASAKDLRQAVINYLIDNNIPTKYCTGFRGISSTIYDIKDSRCLHPEMAKRFYPHLSITETQEKSENFEITFYNSANLCRRFKNKEKLLEKEYKNLLNLFQLCEESSKIIMDITLVGIGFKIFLLFDYSWDIRRNNECLETFRELLITAPLHDMTSLAIMALMNIKAPLFPLGFKDPALKPHLYKLKSDELDFVKRQNAWEPNKPIEKPKSNTPTEPPESSYCRIM